MFRLVVLDVEGGGVAGSGNVPGWAGICRLGV